MNYYELLIRRSRGVEPPAPAIPTDTFLYMPFSSNLLDHSTYARSFTTTGTTPTLETVDGILCATFPANTYMRSSDTTGFTGQGNCTLSMWMKTEGYPTGEYNFCLCLGAAGSIKKCTSIGFESRTKFGGGIWGGNGNTQVAPCDVDFNWHHLCYVFDTDHNDVYLDGVKIWTSTTTDTLSIEGGGWGIGNTSTQFSFPPGVTIHYAGIRAYYRAITSEELLALASEFTPTPQVTFANQTATFVYSAGSSTYTLVTNPTGCTFSLASGTLPSGVTFDTATGVLSYDGSAISQDSTTTVTITASKTGYLSNTATITIKMQVEVHSVRFAAGVDTTLYLTNTNGVFVATPSGSWGGTGYHSGISGTWVSFYPKHGVKYSLDGGATYQDWCFEDTNATLDLSSVGTTIASVTKVSGRDTVSLSGQQITVNDPSGSSAIYEFDVTME